ncbi:DUF6341 family protein [Aequorivita xiaoshiensis]|uniref:DUF6341 family protein n=1 Tax=Aequorivita xiaoshiensis TaxID=2874476 RepID=UPI0030BA25F7
MALKDIWEGIASFFETVLLNPLDGMRDFELQTWWGANIMSWIFLAIGSVAFVYWLIQLKKYDENTDDTHTYEETV